MGNQHLVKGPDSTPSLGGIATCLLLNLNFLRFMRAPQEASKMNAICELTSPVFLFLKPLLGESPG